MTGAAALLLSLVLPVSTETAEANGDTRTISLYHSHTGESIEATFRVNGHYDPAVLHKLNWFLRDFRRDEQTNMDPRLFDVVWEAYRAAGANQPIVVYSAYRSPETNAMLRRRSRAVAEFSQHMLGKAMDTTMPGMSMERIREIGMRMQRGGVGWYPSSNFVHLDVGHVRSWPRMNYEQLVRLFPDGKTVHLASNGRALPRFEEARAEIEANGGGAPVYMEQPKSKGLFAWLFGSRDDEDEGETQAPPPRYVPRAAPQRTVIASRTATDLPTSSDSRMVWTDRRGTRAAANALPAGPLAGAPSTPSPASAPPLRAPEPAPRTVVAALPPSRNQLDRGLTTASIASAKTDKNTIEKPEKAVETAVLMPSPPRRPNDLVAAIEEETAVPMPPSRPVTLASLASANLPQESVLPPRPERIPERVATLDLSLSPTADNRPSPALQPRLPQGPAPALPRLITQGTREPDHPASRSDLSSNPVPEASNTILAYAPTAQMQGLRSAATLKSAVVKASLKAAPAPSPNPQRLAVLPSQAGEMVPARLDPSNFWVMTGATAMKNADPSLFGSAINGLRAAARGTAPILSKNLSAGSATSFHAEADRLPTDHFAAASDATDKVSRELISRNPANAVQVIDRSLRQTN